MTAQDLGVDPADPVTLVIAYHMDAKTTGEMTREEFMQGMQRMRASSLADLKASRPAGSASRMRQNRRSASPIHPILHPRPVSDTPPHLCLLASHASCQRLLAFHAPTPVPGGIPHPRSCAC